MSPIQLISDRGHRYLPPIRVSKHNLENPQGITEERNADGNQRGR